MYLKLLLAGGIAAASFYVGIRYERGERAEDLEAELAGARQGIVEAVNGLDEAWRSKAAKAEVSVLEWREQQARDEELIRAVLAGQASLRRDFAEIDHDIEITGDFGTCVLTADAVRLLRAASAAANATQPDP